MTESVFGMHVHAATTVDGRDRTKLVATLAACRPHGEALQLRLHELGQRTLPALLEAHEEARQVPPYEHRRVAVVGLAGD